MVFYFSGTGNSYQAALAMCAEGEQPLDMAKCLREGSFREGGIRREDAYVLAYHELFRPERGA